MSRSLLTKAVKGQIGSAEDLTQGDGFVTVPMAAQFLRLSRAKVYQLMDVGELSFCKFGKSRRIPRQALAELVERSLVTR